ncbi:MAG: sulfotransferase family 2 domain-containing protein [Bauldia sp.]
MIVSHRYRFIFLKTMKTAGTSFEIALSSVCGPKDIITEITGNDEETRRQLGFRGAQNDRQPWLRLTPRGLARAILRRQRPVGLMNHEPAAKMKRVLPAEVWRDYYKFTIVRNPWDRMVSLYFYQTRAEKPRPSFHDYLVGNPARVLDNWGIYTIGGKPVTDGVIRYEALPETIAEISRAAGIPASVLDVFRSQNAKAQHRDRSFRMAAGDADLIGLLAEPERLAFGYDAPPPGLVEAATR